MGLGSLVGTKRAPRSGILCCVSVPSDLFRRIPSQLHILRDSIELPHLQFELAFERAPQLFALPAFPFSGDRLKKAPRSLAM